MDVTYDYIIIFIIRIRKNIVYNRGKLDLDFVWQLGAGIMYSIKLHR